MTNQEAIETIKVAISEVEWNYPMEYAVAFEKAIEALETQIPKAPIAEIRKVDTVIGNGTWKAGTTVHKCPVCGTWMSRIWKHCAFCGQKLDWGDVK